MKKWKKKAKYISVSSFTQPSVGVYRKFEDSALKGPEKSEERFGERKKKKNGQIKGMISIRMLILSYTIQLALPNVLYQISKS